MSRGAKPRLATLWLAGCSGCHMSLLDLDEALLELHARVELVYGPLVDIKEFPANVDICLIEGAVANVDNLELLDRARRNSRLLVSLGDCAITGNITALRNGGQVTAMLDTIYRTGPGRAPIGPAAVRSLPALLPKVLPLHQVIEVDAFIPGCPPDPARIRTALEALLRGEPVHLSAEQLTFG
ncbi:MAG: hypothetical protein RQ723_10510 [Desulfuromonadales bacterium]|nr:hypothetical protein [Desulfuromonadales bacterium]